MNSRFCCSPTGRLQMLSTMADDREAGTSLAESSALVVGGAGAYRRSAIRWTASAARGIASPAHAASVKSPWSSNQLGTLRHAQK